MRKFFILFFVFFNVLIIQGQQIAVLKYDGGGDWYSNPTALKNLIQFCNKNIDTTLEPQPQVVHPEDPALFGYPFRTHDRTW